MKSLIEINEYEHNGIKITVEINHISGKVSLLDKIISIDERSFRRKEYIFAGRGLEYMKSWQNILDAMKYAISEATKLLEHDLAENSKFRDEDREIERISRNFYFK